MAFAGAAAMSARAAMGCLNVPTLDGTMKLLMPKPTKKEAGHDLRGVLRTHLSLRHNRRGRHG